MSKSNMSFGKFKKQLLDELESFEAYVDKDISTSWPDEPSEFLDKQDFKDWLNSLEEFLNTR
jgi:hypothetical protein